MAMQLDRPHCIQGWLLIRMRRGGSREGGLHLHNESTTSTAATTKDLSLKQRNEFHCFREGTKYSRFSIFYFSLWLRLHCLAQSLCLGLALPLLKHFLSFLTLFVSLFLFADVNMVAEPKAHQIGRKRQNVSKTGNDWWVQNQRKWREKCGEKGGRKTIWKITISCLSF